MNVITSNNICLDTVNKISKGTLFHKKTKFDITG